MLSQEEISNILDNEDGLDSQDFNVRKKFYGGKLWKFVRENFLLLQKNYQCNYCKKNLSGRNWLSLNVDHKKPIKYYWQERYDYKNLQILCHTCNQVKSNRTINTDKEEYTIAKESIKLQDMEFIPETKLIKKEDLK
jgi:hypothetical protein